MKTGFKIVLEAVAFECCACARQGEVALARFTSVASKGKVGRLEFFFGHVADRYLPEEESKMAKTVGRGSIKK